MKLTILGKYGPYPCAGGACSSYLIKSNDASIVLDMGSGSLSNLMKHIDFCKVDAIILSHLHSDHISDIFVLRYALQLKKCGQIPLYLPGSPENMFHLLYTESVFNHTVITQDLKIKIKDIAVEFSPMTHPVESYAIKLTAGDKTLVYSGDTSKGDSLAPFAHNADLLLCDAAFSNETAPKNPPHLTSEKAAQAAKEANVRSLLLSHINPDQDEQALLAQAQKVFTNSLIAEEGKTYTL